MRFKNNKIDIYLLLPIILLIFASIAIVYSASADYSLSKWHDPAFLFKNHLVRVLISFVVLFFFAKLDYRYLQDISKFIIFGAIILLVLVLVLNSEVKNVNRWIDFGFISFQPSDVAKYALIFHTATLLVKKEGYITNLYRGYLPLVIYLLLVTGLIVLQPNFSTALIIFGTSILMYLSGGVKIKHIVVTLLLLIPIAALFILSKPYIISRFENYAEFSASGNAKQQLTNSLTAIGNGGFFGVGIGNSVMKEFFLPEPYNDFIFSVIGEEYGFVGTMFIIGLFVVILIRGYNVVKKVQDPFGKYVAFGITTIIVSYAIVNISVATGVFPTTGVSIPFISFGGTALILNSIAAGILLNISSYRDVSIEEIQTESAASV